MVDYIFRYGQVHTIKMIILIRKAKKFHVSKCVTGLYVEIAPITWLSQYKVINFQGNEVPISSSLSKAFFNP